jgi:hypothetical protein
MNENMQYLAFLLSIELIEFSYPLPCFPSTIWKSTHFPSISRQYVSLGEVMQACNPSTGK